MKRSAISFAALAMLSGCANTAAPLVAPLAPAWTQANAAPQPATRDWWRAYHDPVLDDLVARALANNPDAEVALARLDQARAAAHEAHAGLVPSGTVTGDVARASQSIDAGLGQFSRDVPDLSRNQREATLTAGLGWDLDCAGGLRHGAHAAHAEAAAARAGLDAAQLGIAAEVVDAYIAHAQARATAAIGAARRAALADRLRYAEARLARQDAAPRVRDEAAAALAAIDAALAMERAEVVISRQRLAILVGVPAETPLPALDANAASIPLAGDPAAGLPGDMLRRRPDLALAEAGVVAAHARVGAALGEYWPHISLGGAIGIDTNILGTFGADSSRLAQGMVGLRWRLFDFARVNAEIAAARGHEREALANWRGAVLKAGEQVESGFVALAARREALAAQETRLAAANAAYAHAAAAQRLGEISDDALRAAALSQLQAEDDHLAARADLARAIAACHRALGG